MGSTAVIVLKVHHDSLRWNRNEFDHADQTGIDMIRIFRLAAAGNEHGEFLIRRDVEDFSNFEGSCASIGWFKARNQAKRAHRNGPFILRGYGIRACIVNPLVAKIAP